MSADTISVGYGYVKAPIWNLKIAPDDMCVR